MIIFKSIRVHLFFFYLQGQGTLKDVIVTVYLLRYFQTNNNHACAKRMIKRSALAWLSSTTIMRFSFPSHAKKKRKQGILRKDMSCVPWDTKRDVQGIRTVSLPWDAKRYVLQRIPPLKDTYYLKDTSKGDSLQKQRREESLQQSCAFFLYPFFVFDNHASALRMHAKKKRFGIPLKGCIF